MTSVVSSFLSLFRKSEARKTMITACTRLKIRRLKYGIDAGIALNIQGGFGPTSVMIIRLKNIRIAMVSKEKILKNQLLNRVFISYLATVLILRIESI